MPHQEASDEQLTAFAYAVRYHLGDRKQAWLAREVGVTSESVSSWLRETRRYEPRRDNVFAVEAALDLPPGTLSALLGYLPVTRIGVEQAIASDPSLSPAQQRNLLTAYSAARSRSARP